MPAPTPIDPLNAMQVAHEIARLTALLEDRTDEYAVDIREAAEADARFKGAWARAMLVVIQGSPPRTTVAEKDARCEVEVNAERITAEVKQAKAKATNASLKALTTQIDALRSLGANLRNQT